MTVRRPVPRRMLMVLGLLTLTVGGAALAWACTPTANVAVSGTGGPGYASPGEQATVAVNSYSEGAAVTVHWNGANGPVLARGTGPSFTASVTIPNVANGNYVIVSKAIDDTGVERRGFAPIIVGEPGAATPGEDQPQGGSNSGATSGAAPGGTVRSPAPGGTSGSTSGGQATTTGGERSAVVSGARRTKGESRATGTPANAGVTTLKSGQAVFADSIGANTPKTAAGKRKATTRFSKAAPSKRTASGDLWSGFSSGKASARGLGESAGPVSGPGSALSVGLLLAGFGLVTLLAGVAGAEARRRRLSRSSAR